MARISGVNIPNDKVTYISLTKIYGIGRTSAFIICSSVQVDPYTRVRDLNEEQIKRIIRVIDEKHIVEGDLKSKIKKNIQHLVEIKCYRGLRHIKRLPVRGQRTHTNARTRKGKSLAIAGKKVIRQ